MIVLKKEHENVWFYGISAKRYVLYEMKKNNSVIIDHKLHGLGHILNPFGTEKDWQKEIWQDILDLHYNKITEKELLEKYSNYYCISQLTITNYEIGKRFKKLNKGKPLSEQIKPFNFFLVGIGNHSEIKPVSPFTKDNQKIVHESFIDYKTGEVLNGLHYWKPLSDIIFNYLNHPESKFNGNTGELERKRIESDSIVYIGKETRNIEEQPLQQQNIIAYKVKLGKEEIKKVGWKQAKELGMPKSTFFYRKSIR